MAINRRILQSIGFSLGMATGLLLWTADIHAAKPLPPKWTHAAQLGSFRVVAIEKASPRKLAVFWEALRATCRTKTHCNVLFVDTRLADEIRALPEREQREKALLVYTTNQGFEWNCKFRPDADNCFTWD
jgi:hypothetical protein